MEQEDKKMKISIRPPSQHVLNGILFFSSYLSQVAWAHSGLELQVEAGPVFETRNEARIPNNLSNSLVNLKGASGVPAAPVGGRAYLGYRFNSHHELRALYAPLTLAGEIQSSEVINFEGQSFAANTELDTIYKFNSYRLSYIYHFEKGAQWAWSLGFTAKIRDAEIRLTDPSSSTASPAKVDLGFVPLLHLGVRYSPSKEWGLGLDVDGSAAPQGRAFDVLLSSEHLLASSGNSFSMWGYFGYRTVEGGADVPEVYTFSWFHSAVLGLRAAL